MPINEFIRLQVAGDLTENKTDGIATGFFALGPTYRSDGGDPDSVAQAKGETLDDRIDTLTRGLLGITGSCARCHDHKFDPIPQQDYYSLAGIFNNTATHLLPFAPDDVVKRFNDHQQAVAELSKPIDKLKKQIKKDKRKANADEQMHLDQWKTQLEALQQDAPPELDAAHALSEAGSSDMHVALRGNLRKTGEVAPRRFLRILAGKEPNPFTKGSGREELAEAIIDPHNPLTARVFVNRVWMHHFGAGLVRTPSNFGTLGEPPTHPQLLDWLASEFVAQGWSLKSLHRQIMTSATYQLSSHFDEVSFASDGDNRLLWRMSPAESSQHGILVGLRSWYREPKFARICRDESSRATCATNSPIGVTHFCPAPTPAPTLTSTRCSPIAFWRTSRTAGCREANNVGKLIC